MSYNDPVINEATRAAVGLDKVLISMQDKFRTIEWLEDRVYLRAYKNTFPDAKGRESSAPEVYTGNDEYLSLLFNDNLPCSLFFFPTDPEKISFVKPLRSVSIPFERTVSLIFWGNLREIGPTYKSDYPYTELIKEEFIRILAGHASVKQIDEYIDDPIEKVFEGFDLPKDKQLGKFPWAGLRINFKVQYEMSVKPC